MVSASFLLLNPEWQKSTWLSQSVDTEHCSEDFCSYQCSGRRNGEMCGDEQKRVDGSIKMKLRMPTTQFAHLLICLFAYLLIWLGQQQHKYVFRYLKWPLLLEEVIWECQQQTEQTKWLGRAYRVGMCVLRLSLILSSVVPSYWVFPVHHSKGLSHRISQLIKLRLPTNNSNSNESILPFPTRKQPPITQYNIQHKETLQPLIYKYSSKSTHE